MNQTELFLLAMLLIYTVPFLVWRLFRTDYFAPLVVVQIIMGIVLGPGVIGDLYPEYYQFVFTGPVITGLNSVAWWAVMLFVMLAGLELDLAAAWKDRKSTAVTAGFALVVPLIFGTLAALLILKIGSGAMGPKAMGWQFALGIGMSCAVTALPILILLMEKMQILRTNLGQRILRYASVDDIAIWGVLALILLDWERVGRQLGFFVVFAIATVLARRGFSALNESDRWPLLLVWLILCAFASDWAGLHYMVGAFLAGAVLDAKWFGQDKLDTMRYYVLYLLMPVFFLSTGLRTQWDVGGTIVFVWAGILLIAAVSGKLIGVHIAGRILKWPQGEAKTIGWFLQTKALIMIIFANILLDKGVITNAMFTALLLMAVASTMLTTPMVAKRLASQRLA
jgi:Kef-type K+ transport system membrane component KefB